MPAKKQRQQQQTLIDLYINDNLRRQAKLITKCFAAVIIKLICHQTKHKNVSFAQLNLHKSNPQLAQKKKNVYLS